SGVSVVLAGYLGIFSVLISLFLIMGRIAGRDSVRSFARGFAALFAGEIAGVLLGGAIGAVPGAFDVSAALVAAAGVAVMYAYLFLFTERDMAALSVVVAQTDRFEEACARIVGEAKLSKREAEILPLALRGRTAERIAGEFFISKNTVDTHLRRIYAKCGVHTRQELIDLAERTEGELS
uniref:helix-turn-helix transcriptional regulator n=2 Tax=Adlercreutzia caecimuris TaxID=671266 RepID=UPI002570E864